MSAQAPDAKPANSKPVSILDLQAKKDRGQPITMVTAYDLSSARLVDGAGIDVILVGDSLAMVMLGMESTVPLTMDELVHHCRAVARGTRRGFLVGDLPFLSYEVEISQALRNAGRLLKEGGMGAVKLEGGRVMAPTVRALVERGIPVMGHVGLTPQSISQLGGYRVQGKTAESAHGLLEDALALEAAGCFSVVLESVPAAVAEVITGRLRIPTIGIGAGVDCDGQVLVYHDMLGLFDDFQPRFVKRYAEVGEAIRRALGEYREDVLEKRFPAEEHTYSMPDEELQKFLRSVGE